MDKGILIFFSYILIILALFLPIYISNNRKKKKFREMMESLKIGDNIITIGGIHGSIIKILDRTIEIKIDKGVSLTISKEAISRVVK